MNTSNNTIDHPADSTNHPHKVLCVMCYIYVKRELFSAPRSQTV